MQTINVRELRSVIPNLASTLAVEKELLLTSHGKVIARILPVDAAPKIKPLATFRARIGKVLPDSTADIRAERDKR